MAWSTLATQIAGGVASAAGWANLVKGNFAEIGPHVRLRKTADEPVTSSTALQDDDHLTFAIAANEVWVFSLTLQVVAPASGGFNRTIAGPAGATGFWNEAYTLIADSKATAFTKSLGSATSESSQRTTAEYEQISGIIINSTTAGSCRLQWAQGTSNGTSTIVKAGSFLLAHRIG